MEIANRLISLLPAGPTYVPETITAVTAYNSSGGTTPSYTPATFNQILAGGRSSYVQGYTANDLARHLALSMIPIGLGDSESAKMLRHTLNHIDEAASDTNTVLEHLMKADTMSRNVAIQEGAALATQTKKPS